MPIVYVTKSVNADLTCHHDGKFQYPDFGMVEAPDWNENEKCGNGLHGFLWGEGDGSLAIFGESAKWLLIKVDTENGMIELGGKVKFRCGEIVFVGTCAEVTEELKKYIPTDRVYSVIGSTLTGGDGSTLTGGDRSTLTGGYRSTLTGGDRSTLTGGDGSTLTGGDDAIFSVLYYDAKRNKWRRKFAVVGEDGIEPNVQYKLDENFNFVKVS
jgi:hypothetical protein